ncbi:MAG: DNA polymerase I [Nitrospirae bacterium]|nr:MAG: DNA polymerase I [Nitrospirota bacterium]
MTKPSNIYLIDGNSYVYRAFHAIKNLSNSRGFPTNAVFGFTNMLFKMLRERQPDAIAIAFDSAAPTERHQLYDEYKAQRPETPSDLLLQIPYVREIVKALRIKTYEIPGYEADDILATLALQAEAEGIEVYIVSGDKDMFQVLSENLKLYDPMKQKELTGSDIQKRFGIPPGRIPELMALVGDTTDNIPGVKGIGEKTASMLLKRHSLDEILKNPSVIENPRIRGLIENSVDDIILSRELATIRRDVPLQFNPDECILQEPDYKHLLSLFRELEFGSLVRMIPSEGTVSNVRTILKTEELEESLGEDRERFIFQSLITGRVLQGGSVLGVGFLGKDCPIYVPTGHNYLDMPVQIPEGELYNHLKTVFQNRNLPKLGHDLKEEIKLLRLKGVELEGEVDDLMIASYLLNPNRSDHRLGEIALEFLSTRIEEPDEFFKNRDPSGVQIEEAADFIGKRLGVVEELADLLFKQLDQEGLTRLYREIEIPLIGVLADMEMYGIRVDTAGLKELSRHFETELITLRRMIYDLAGEEFNINSPKQLSRILFEKIGLEPIKKTKTGYSTDTGVLTELAKSHELPDLILQWRSLTKLKSTYIDSLPKLINPLTGRIHTTFNQTVTATGRLSSSDPNLQNIPARGRWGEKIREAFIPEDGFLLMSADYSQIELRILAHLSGDHTLIESFKKGIDIHSLTASEIFGVPENEVTQEMRRTAKTINFGIIYGISPYGLSETLGSSQEEAAKYIERYFEQHLSVKEYFQRVIEDAKTLGYVKTLSGRKRAIPELRGSSKNQRALGERLAMNTPIQGTAADIIKIAMINLKQRIHKEGLRSRMILQVHDELLFEVPDDETQIMHEVVREEMEGAMQLSVPLRVEIGTGPNWASAHG